MQSASANDWCHLVNAVDRNCSTVSSSTSKFQDDGANDERKKPFSFHSQKLIAKFLRSKCSLTNNAEANGREEGLIRTVASLHSLGLRRKMPSEKRPPRFLSSHLKKKKCLLKVTEWAHTASSFSTIMSFCHIGVKYYDINDCKAWSSTTNSRSS